MNEKELLELIKRVPGVENAVLGDTGPQCREITGTFNGEPFFIYVYRGRYSEAPILRIMGVPRGCVEALLSPQGLYVIPYAGDVDLLLKSIEIKLKAVTVMGSQEI